MVKDHELIEIGNVDSVMEEHRSIYRRIFTHEGLTYQSPKGGRFVRRIIAAVVLIALGVTLLASIKMLLNTLLLK